jgi:hypothetical protein
MQRAGRLSSPPEVITSPTGHSRSAGPEPKRGKTQKLLWKAGKPYQLVDADGHVLQGHKVPQDALATLGDRFEQLPEAWSFCVSTPTEDLR